MAGNTDRAKGIRVTTEGELEAALTLAAAEPARLFLIEAVLAGRDCSGGLRRLGAAFRI